jgi:hypothetical protein
MKERKKFARREAKNYHSFPMADTIGAFSEARKDERSTMQGLG